MFWFFLIISIISFTLTWLYRQYAIRKSLLDIPNHRSSHSVPTPTGGGIAVVIAWFGGIGYLFITNSIEKTFFYALLSGVPLVIVSFLDDVLSLKPGIRFITQVISAALALYFLRGMPAIDVGFGMFHLPVVWTVVAFIAILWSINLFNFLDGIDGYIGSEIVFVGLAAFFLLSDLVALLMAVATFGFLIWNWPKARIFMGDVGSTLLGFNVAVFAIFHQNQDASIIFWLIITSVFWFDATITLIRRCRAQVKTKGISSLAEAHKKHAYQRIVQAGFSHLQTTLGMMAINAMLFVICYFAFHNSQFWLIALAITMLILSVVLKWVDSKRPFEKTNI